MKPRSECETSLLEGFRSPRTAALLKPLINLNTKEETFKMADLDRIKDECDEKLMIFDSLIRRHDPSRMDPMDVRENHKSLCEEISNALTSLSKSVRNMTVTHKAAMDTGTINEWKQRVVDAEDKYCNHRSAVYKVIGSTRAQAVPDPVTRPSSTPAPEILSSSTQAKTAEVKSAIEAERIADEGKKLDGEIKGYDDWGDASNEEIEEAMRKIEDWNRRLSKIQDRIYSMKESVQLYNLSNVELAKSVSMMENLKEEMNIAIRNIKEEDEARGLYSLSKSKASDVKLPRFGGKPHENFAKFKAEMLKGFKSNKVRKDDQVKKLRENLFDQPKTMVPFSMESISDAWKILDDMYGDAARVMNAKILELRNLKENSDGGYPRKGGGLNLLRSQIEWITRLEVTLNGIIELGEESDQLDRDAFGSGTVVSVLELFPFHMQRELAKEMGPAKEDGKEKLHFIIKYLKDVRKCTQEMQKTQELRSGSESNRKSRGKQEVGEEGDDEYDGKRREEYRKNKNRYGAHVASRPNKNCKICKYFESHPKKLRGSKTLFAEHYGLGPGGCPRFMELDISMRREVVKEMKICNRCLLNKDPVPQGTAHAGCRITPDTKKADAIDGKIRYHTCNEEECLESFLLCDSPVHMTKNQDKLNKCKEK